MRTPLSALLSRMRPQNEPAHLAERAFREQTLAVISRVRAVFDAWGELRQVEPDYALLANGAAKQRWELMRLAQEVEAISPPRPLAGIQREMLERTVDAARACQLLANGYRSHKSEAICDGQALFVDTLAALDRVANQVAER